MLSDKQFNFYKWFNIFKEKELYLNCGESQLFKIHRRFLRYICDTFDIRTIASDFDLTMMTMHSGGFIDPQSDKGRLFLKSLSREFNILGAVAMEIGLSINVVTFSDPKLIPSEKIETNISGKSMINICLQNSNAKFKVSDYYCFYPRLWQERSEYSNLGLDAPMPPFKTFHLRKVCENENLSADQVLFIDDDIYNCANALKDGYVVLHVNGRSGYSINGLSVDFYKDYL
ncbi:apicomplexan P36 family [Cryptosporidium bovis]|uniref:apicomplexan P36 family n=1 Tax=Cryptosporidium bovis TaxID=310047 RepID=UPI003519E169|nr:apicomplexan P36 family [Cryptosporidium bovis]